VGAGDAENRQQAERDAAADDRLRRRDRRCRGRRARAQGLARGHRRARQAVFPHLARLGTLYSNTGIETRYACQPKDWYYERHGWEARTEVFQRHALALLEEVTLAALANAGIGLKDVSALVVNTITGLAIPSLDAKLMNRLKFPQSVERIPIFGLGCGGGVAGLARAARYAQAMPPDSHVLFLTVDLCSLCLRIADPSMAMFVSAALFGDGAAGVVLRHGERARGRRRGQGRIVAVGDHFWPYTERIMGWDIKEDGFGVVLSPELPALIRKHLAPAVRGFLDANGMSLGEFTGFLLHPGGAKILKTAQRVLGLSRSDLRPFGVDPARFRQHVVTDLPCSRSTAPSNTGAKGPHLLIAFGPGFSAYFVAVDL
jgi:alkylresorcinol/alkylpyrone synthase